MAPGIELIAANLEYNSQLLFHNLNLSLLPGKWTCLLGQSGIGKTSLLRLIAGLSTTVTSSVLRASDDQPLTGRIAYMAQEHSLLPWLSVIDNIALGARLRGAYNAKSNVDARRLLAKVGLEETADSLPHTLSGGMKQRVILARTLFENKSIVLMDEPFAALDVITRTWIQELAAELLQGCTVLLVTHDPLEALRLGHQVYIMSGRPAQITTITLDNQPPRALNASALLQTHAQVIEQLKETHYGHSTP